MIRKGLGKGLGALLVDDAAENAPLRELGINEIEPNLEQPRKNFNDEKLLQLAESIKLHGVVQPIIVKKDNEVFRIVTGERRWRAARLAGLKNIPAIVRDLSGKQVMEIALIENLQREDLNPVEEAEAYEKLLNEYNMTQEDISTAIGKSRPAIANSLRLLSLSQKIKVFMINGDLSSGHARALLSLEDEDIRHKMAEYIIQRKLSVRETESLVKRQLSKKQGKKIKKFAEEYTEIEDKLKNIFGTKVKIISDNKKGKILIEYYSNSDLDRILELVDTIPGKR